jgi:hypothetical protein
MEGVMKLRTLALYGLVVLADEARKHWIVSLMVLLAVIGGMALIWPRVPGAVDSTKLGIRQAFQDFVKGTRDEWRLCYRAPDWHNCKTHPRRVTYDLPCQPDGYCGAFCNKFELFSKGGAQYSVKGCEASLVVEIYRYAGPSPNARRRVSYTLEPGGTGKTRAFCARFWLSTEWQRYYASCSVHVVAD